MRVCVCVCARAWVSSHTPNDVGLLSDLGIHGQGLQQATLSLTLAVEKGCELRFRV